MQHPPPPPQPLTPPPPPLKKTSPLASPPSPLSTAPFFTPRTHSSSLTPLLSSPKASLNFSPTTATAYGALCSVLCSILISSNGRQNHVILGSLVERFISWALSLLTNVNIGDGTTELALESLREFLNVGDVGAVERYAVQILKACQELLEDERTSLSLLHQLLGVLTLISLKFFRCFQPHFVDIVDLLLGWAMVPDLAESDRRVIMDSFLQFQKHWVNSLQFSLGLLSKFLGDMDVLLQDGSLGTPRPFQRLLALLSCFCTVLQSTASGLLEMNLLEQIIEPLSKMIPVLLGCLSTVGRKFGWSKWIADSWRCLTLLAEILSERFSTFYPLVADVLFQSLEMDNHNQLVGTGKITSFQVHGVLRTNLQLLSLQNLGLLPSSVRKILQFGSPISQLRLHPNHLVTGSSAATYIFLLQHGKDEVVEQAMTSLIEELELLKGMIGRTSCNIDEVNSEVSPKIYSKPELFSLIKFDLKVLLSCVSVGGGNSLVARAELDALCLKRLERLASFIVDKLNPFNLPIQGFVELQANVIKTLDQLTMFELLNKCSVRKPINRSGSVTIASETLSKDDTMKDGFPVLIFEHLQKYNYLLVKALHNSSPLVVKVEALQWIYKFCEAVIDMYENINATNYPCDQFGYVGVVGNLVFSVLYAASDREPKVRSHVASVLELLLQAKLIHPVHFYAISEVVLEKLGDPDSEIKNLFVRMLSYVLPITIYVCGLHDHGMVNTCRPSVPRFGYGCNLYWKQVFALKQLPQQLHSQHLVSILSFISQRWKVPLSSWIQRFIYTCRSSKEFSLSQLEETGSSCVNDIGLDIKFEEDILEKICSVNILAGAWWAIHEAARYCITTRLRTNLGGPTQTFAALERMLLDIAHVLQLDTEQNDGNLNIIGSSYAHLLPMRLLLDFVEALKKHVYNAYEGSTVLPCASRQSSLFFRANRKVCEEWFSRICEPMMNAGLALQCHHATIHYCTVRLQELRNLVASALNDKPMAQVAENLHNIKGRFSEDIVRVLRHMALALCKSHESEALIGLQKWVTMTFSSLLTDENHDESTGEDLGPFSWIAGLVYQAEGKYEKAAALFTHLLQTEKSLSSMGSDGVQFAIARIIESYAAVSNWKSLESWLLELQTLRAKHAGRSYTGALTTAGNEINSIHALAHFDEGDFQAAWTCLDLTPKSSSELTLDPKLALQRSEQMLLQAMLLQTEGKVEKMSHEIQKAKSMLEESLSVLPLDGLAEAAAYATQLHCIFAFEESCKLKGSQDKLLQSLLSPLVQVLQSPINRVHQDCNMWLKVLRVHRTILPTSSVTLELSKNLLSLARKQGNLALANRLNNYVRDHALSCPEGRYRDFLMTNLQYEGILLMYAENRLQDAFTNLWSFLRPCMVSSSSVVSDVDVNVLNAKACLKLTDWLRRDYSDMSLENIVIKMLADFSKSDISSLGRRESSFSDDNFSSKPNVALIIEELVGTATKLSSRLCPSLGKSWISYASWCYSQARASLSTPTETALHSCSFSSILALDVLPNRFELTEEELLKVKSIVFQLLQKRGNSEDLSEDGVYCNFQLESSESNETYLKVLVQQTVSIIEAAAGAPGAESFSGECLAYVLTSQLQKCYLSANVGLEESAVLSSVDDLVDIWWSLRRRRVSLFGHAAQAFIRYLSYSSSKHYDGQLADFISEPLNQKTVNYTMRATLYVLNILLNFGVELKDTLEPALSMAPLLPWQDITPQLFARLSSHPEQVVRKLLEGLVMMLAKLSPWSIVYPTLVDINACEQEPSEELQHILSCLSKLYPRLIQDVKLVIKELEDVTVLWEELWLSTLQDLHADVMRRINLLKEEAARIAENVTLSSSEKNKINTAKYSAMMAPIVVALERRLASTSRKPETPHEIWFHEEYSEQLKSAILNFKTPPASAAVLGDVWRPFDSIAASLASYQRKSSISLGEVAPNLTRLSSSDVPMPGLEKQIAISESDGGLTAPQGIVTIASFTEQVAILSTKTKPKKIAIMGSDGQKYTYLLKGREDLRLDARIMQLLQAINGFLHSSSATSSQSLSVRYYSVTPISGRAGLIQWVDNVTSIYSIFKSWQNRAQLAQLQALGTGNTKDSGLPPVPRPIDMFYGKIIPALKEKGIRRVISRRDWPQEVKRKVLLDLMKEAPKQLLHQELWCASEGFKAFSSKLRRYSGSVAAMSMVGHILGLGDRHLDNILIDFSSGDILHIDYNVCFDKGQRLKIPEIVPFRLTQTIEGALGLTGIEGTFRANCEAVLGVLRKNKDIMLMLLEVFVWDPLVEWTRGDFHDDAAIIGEERKGMELAVSLSLFASRVQEIRVPLQEHHDLLLDSLPAVESAFERFASILNQYELVYALFHRADQERSNLVLHETSAKSIVAEATSNSEKTRASFEIQARELSQAKAVVAERAQEATTWMEQHRRILDALRSSSILEIKAYLQLTGTEEALSLTSAVPVAGVPLTIVPEPTQVHCHDIDREVLQIIAELSHGLSSAVTAVQEYSLALQRILPLNYLTTSPLHGLAQLLELSVNSLSSDILSLARRQAAELIAKVHGDGFDSSRGSYDDLCFKVEKYAEQIEKIEKEYAELVKSIGSETESRAKDRLLSTFMKYMQSAGLPRKEDASSAMHLKHDVTDVRLQGELEEKREKVVTVLNIATSSVYSEVKRRVLDIFSPSIGHRSTENVLQSYLGTIFSDFEEQVEKCVLVAGFVGELLQFMGGDLPSVDTDDDHSNYFFQRNWASVFKTSLLSCKNLVGKMIEVVLPDVIRSVVSFNSEVMDAFGSLSQIRGSIDTALEQLVEVESERASLVELEQNYFVRVGLITEQQLALEEAAVKGRDHLSWEEAEELASQEEACRAQLDKLHQTWNHKDVRTSSLMKREASIRSALFSCENHFQSLVSAEQDSESHIARSKALLAALVQPFSELESIDKALASLDGSVTSWSNGISRLEDLMSSGRPISEYIWKFPSLMNNHSFFIWKVGILDSFLDSCIHDTASSVDRNLGFDQLLNIVKKKLEIQLQEHIGQFLKERVGPILLARLDKENEILKQLTETTKEVAFDQAKKDLGAVRRVQLMLEEYCNAHETVRAAMSAASLMKRQVNELKEALRKTILEIVQMEWVHDVNPNPLHNVRLISHNFLANEDNLFPIILSLSRPKLMESIQSSVSKIARSMENLQTCERTSATAEGQLERAMGWACGGPNSGATGSNSSRTSGIPPEFHNHLMRRRQLLWEAQEKASDIIKICMSILEFEASRDGIFRISGDLYPFRTGANGKTWQQAYLNALTRLDVTYHSFTRAEQEWKLAQNNMEAASNGLFSVTNDLCIASVKAKSASGDLQSTLVAMRDCAYEASLALSAFASVVRGHTALTSECGSMLEEVLAITEGLHDVHSLGKEAAAVHRSLMKDLSKANTILLPLESVLSKDVAAMTDAMARERETKMEISPIHGQAIYQSYYSRIKEVYQSFKPLVPSLTIAVKGLHSMLTRLARTASLHAGSLHKALEGLGESQEVRSQDINLPEVAGHDSDDNGKEGEVFSKSDGESDEDSLGVSGLSLQEKEWISPPDSICDSSSETGATSAEGSLADSFNDPEVEQHVHSSISMETKGYLKPAPLSGIDSQQIRQHEQSESRYKEASNGETGSTDECLKLGESLYDESVSSVVETLKSVNPESQQVKFGLKDEPSSLNHDKIEDEDLEDEDRETPFSATDVGNRVARGKNAYAISVLKRVEIKLDGRDIADNRDISVAEQVEYLLKQATSLDNLCNMYEGWTPWI
ncbi:Serine/threonine-protein kinase [Actinidia chinensis var. chinensis]|uniref:non-specific serine/threonine protein kinase n=1 Tax=Actinidia chinensis var. chinensis TaxID=1590841 RepID=A0A2R6RC04_ACTCC|nr:Serine/threonine-protein kinase [Actinidia chinensis var. chinensis]